LIRIKLVIVTLIFSFISSNSYAILCPRNFNEIQVGVSMDEVIRLCGVPDDQSSYQETISASQNLGTSNSNGNSYQSPQQMNSQEYSNSQQINDVKSKTITVTKFVYGKPQPALLIFIDGKLKERQIIPLGTAN
jgi:hypothetical protein